MARGDLEVLRLLGEGGHGAVYLARHRGSLGFERLVALKVVRQNARLPEIVATRFVHEARLLGLLRHRAIVTADDVVELDIGTAIVMEYVPGIDLFDVLRLNHRQPGSIPVAWMAHVGLEVASALAAAWSSPSALTGQPLRVLHCDVKPSNVRICPNGEVKLLDFGVSTSLIDDTVDGPVMGTLGYVAPERLETGRTGPASDLFSLGLTLLAAARGRGMNDRPVDAASLPGWTRRALAELPPAYAPLLDVLRDLLSSDAALRPDHDEVRSRLFALLRAHADVPPADLSGALVTRVQDAGRQDVGAEATEPETVHPASDPLPRTLDDAAAQERARAPVARPAIPPPPAGPGHAGVRGPPPLPPPVAPIPPPAPLSAHAGARLDDTTHRTPDEPDASSDADRAEFSRIVASWGPSKGAPPRPEAPPRRAGGQSTAVDRVFAAAAELSGWFDLDQAQAVLGPELQRTGHALPRVLDDLVREGALQGTRLDGVAHARLAPSHLAMAAHALARWPAPARSRLIQRHAAHLIARTSDAWLDRLCQGLGPAAVQLDGLERNLERVVTRDVPNASVSCALALAVIRAHRSGALEDLSTRLDALLSHPDATAAERVRVHRWRGQFAVEAARATPEKVLETVDRGLDAARAIGDHRNEAALWGQRGMWLLWMGERDEAIEAMSRARRMSEEQGDALRACVASTDLAQVLARSGRRGEARRMARQAERACREIGARRLHVTLLGALADHSREEGDIERALRFSSRAVHAAQTLARPDALAQALASRGLVYLESGDLEGAEEDLSEAQAHYGPSRGRMHAWTTAWLAGAHLRMGRVDHAAAELATLERDRPGVFGESAIVVDAWTARVEKARARPTAARAALQRAEAAMAALAPLESPSVRRLLKVAREIVQAP